MALTRVVLSMFDGGTRPSAEQAANVEESSTGSNCRRKEEKDAIHTTIPLPRAIGNSLEF